MESDLEARAREIAVKWAEDPLDHDELMAEVIELCRQVAGEAARDATKLALECVAIERRWWAGVAGEPVTGDNAASIVAGVRACDLIKLRIKREVELRDRIADVEASAPSTGEAGQVASSLGCLDCGRASCSGDCTEIVGGLVRPAAPQVERVCLSDEGCKGGLHSGRCATASFRSKPAAPPAVQAGTQQPAVRQGGEPGLPPHLRDDAPFVRCNACGRKSWDKDSPGTTCGMPQPNGSVCAGRFSKQPNPRLVGQLVRERDEARAELVRWQKAHEAAWENQSTLAAETRQFRGWHERAVAERDAATLRAERAEAEVGRLRLALQAAMGHS